jgi:hypothetical protein
MKKIKVGFGRIYNAKGCLHLGSENVSIKIRVDDIEINVSIGPNLKHKVMTMKFGPPQHKDEKLRQRGTRAKGYQHPALHYFW